jgi:chromosome segregation ATPase
MSSSLIEWVLLLFNEFYVDGHDNIIIESDLKATISKVGKTLFNIYDLGNEKCYDVIIDKLDEYFDGSVKALLISSDMIFCEALLCYAVSAECEYRDLCISKIMELDRDSQVELMNIIQENLSKHIQLSPVFTPPASTSTSIDDNSSMKKMQNPTYCMECTEKDEVIKVIRAKLVKSEANILEIENKLKSNVSSETHKLIDAEIQVIEKERLISEISSELYNVKSKLVDYEKKYADYERLSTQVHHLQDQIEILQPQAQKAETYELQLEKMRDKLDELKGIKQQYQDETAAHSFTYGKLLEVEAEVEVLRKLKIQVDEYREQLSEVTIELEEVRLRLVNREQELSKLQVAYEDVCNRHDVTVKERIQLSQDLQATNEILRSDHPSGVSLGEGISEFNPALMQEISKLRADNLALQQQLDATSIEALDRLSKELADQSSINSSLTKKLVDTKDQLAKALLRIADLERDYSSLSNDYKLHQQQHNEFELMVEEDMQEQRNVHIREIQHQQEYYSSSYDLLRKGKESVISSMTDDYADLDHRFNECSSNLVQTIEAKISLENELQTTCQRLEETSRKRQREHDEHLEELNHLREDYDLKYKQQLESSANDMKLLEMKHHADIELYEERLRSMQADMDEEQVKRRRIEREKRVLESDIQRYKTQSQTNHAGSMNSENMDVVMKEFKIMQQELENARVEIIALRSGASTKQATSSDSIDSNARSESAGGASRLSRPVRLRVLSVESSTSNHDPSYANYLDVAEMNDRKLDILAKEKRELLAKNLECEKEKTSMNQQLLQSEKEISSLKSKVTKLTLENERLERRIARQEPSH